MHNKNRYPKTAAIGLSLALGASLVGGCTAGRRTNPSPSESTAPTCARHQVYHDWLQMLTSRPGGMISGDPTRTARVMREAVNAYRQNHATYADVTAEVPPGSEDNALYQATAEYSGRLLLDALQRDGRIPESSLQVEINIRGGASKGDPAPKANAINEAITVFNGCPPPAHPASPSA